MIQVILGSHLFFYQQKYHYSQLLVNFYNLLRYLKIIDKILCYNYFLSMKYKLGLVKLILIFLPYLGIKFLYFMNLDHKKNHL